MRAFREEQGFTIVEMMVAVVILLTGALGTMVVLDTASHKTRSADDRQEATALAREVVEAAKAIPYRQLTPDTLVARLREDSDIAGTSGSPWRVEREGTTFGVDATACSVDEPADGFGSHAGGSFCTGATAGGSSDRNPVDFKRVTVVVTWSNGTGRGTVRQATLVSASASGETPAVESVRLTSPLGTPITDPARLSASFAVTTASNAVSVIWSVDGSQRGVASGSGRNWTFNWDLPADGTYDVGAQTIEPSGSVGPPKSLTVIVNRSLPRAVQGFTAGRNGAGVEAQWSASRDRDVVGYIVYRQASTGQPAVACAFTDKTSCVDASAPASTAGILDYWVVAIEEVEDVRREGAPSTRVDVNGINRPPNAPRTLTLAKDAQGNSVLQWAAPSPADPDTGDFIASYHVYRDGTDFAHRYGTVGGAELTTTDMKTGGSTHQYWVASVDSHLAESALLGPVSG